MAEVRHVSGLWITRLFVFLRRPHILHSGGDRVVIFKDHTMGLHTRKRQARQV